MKIVHRKKQKKRQGFRKNLKENVRIYMCTFFSIHSWFRKPDGKLLNETLVYKIHTPRKCIYCDQKQSKPFKHNLWNTLFHGTRLEY